VNGDNYLIVFLVRTEFLSMTSVTEGKHEGDKKALNFVFCDCLIFNCFS
jgi:hypothetical protein